MPSGAAAELCAAADVDGIPIELWDVPQPEQRQTEKTRYSSLAGNDWSQP